MVDVYRKEAGYSAPRRPIPETGYPGKGRNLRGKGKRRRTNVPLGLDSMPACLIQDLCLDDVMVTTLKKKNLCRNCL